MAAAPLPVDVRKIDLARTKLNQSVQSLGLKYKDAMDRAHQMAASQNRSSVRLWMKRASDIDRALTQRTQQLLNVERYIDIVLQANVNKETVDLLRQLAAQIEATQTTTLDDIELVLDDVTDTTEHVGAATSLLAEPFLRGGDNDDDPLLDAADDALLEKEIDAMMAGRSGPLPTTTTTTAAAGVSIVSKPPLVAAPQAVQAKIAQAVADEIAQRRQSSSSTMTPKKTPVKL